MLAGATVANVPQCLRLDAKLYMAEINLMFEMQHSVFRGSGRRRFMHRRRQFGITWGFDQPKPQIRRPASSIASIGLSMVSFDKDTDPMGDRGESVQAEACGRRVG